MFSEYYSIQGLVTLNETLRRVYSNIKKREGMLESFHAGGAHLDAAEGQRGYRAFHIYLTLRPPSLNLPLEHR